MISTRQIIKAAPLTLCLFQFVEVRASVDQTGIIYLLFPCYSQDVLEIGHNKSCV